MADILEDDLNLCMFETHACMFQTISSRSQEHEEIVSSGLHSVPVRKFWNHRREPQNYD